MDSVLSVKQRFGIIGDNPKLNRALEKSIQVANRLMSKKGRLLIRKSGTESKIRIMGESNDRNLILKCIKLIKKSIK